MTTKKVTIKPGQEVPVTGTYTDLKSGQEVHLTKGNYAPPTAHTHGDWHLVSEAYPSHSGEALAGHGPYSVDAKAIAALHEAAHPQDRADGPLHPEHHPSERWELPAVPAKGSAVLYETEGLKP